VCVGQVVVAGSYRRRKETVGDLDLLVTATPDSDVMDRFVSFEEIAEVLGHGRTRSTVRLRSGLQVDVRVVPEGSYGAALHYFTGSKAHNIAVRSRGVERGLKINEYGVFKDDSQIAGRSEGEVYAQVGLPYIEPEMRANHGEIEAALEGRLPRLITLADIKGDLHAHTAETDGRATLKEMVEGARAKGYRFLAITDHSQRVAMARGLDAKRLARQIRAIDRLNERLDSIVILKGIEVDILEDGSLDLPEAILKQLDLRVCSVHYSLNLPSDRQTERILRAMDNRYCDIIGHPTGGRRRADHAGGARARLFSRAQRPAGPARPQRRALPDGERARPQGRDLDRRPQRRQPRPDALWRRPGAPRLAGAEGRPQHPYLAAAEEAAPAGVNRTRAISNSALLIWVKADHAAGAADQSGAKGFLRSGWMRKGERRCSLSAAGPK
jgi:hypothetical protein